MPAPRRHHPTRGRPSSLRRPGTAVLTGLAVLLATGCVAPPDGDPSGTGQPRTADADGTRSGHSAAHLAADAVGRLTGGSGSDLTAPPDLVEPVPLRDPDGPERAAVAVILGGLAAEGLLVTSIDTEVVVTDGQHATVVVTAAHSPGHGHPTQSRYELELARTTDGWTLAHHREQR